MIRKILEEIWFGITVAMVLFGWFLVGWYIYNLLPPY